MFVSRSRLIVIVSLVAIVGCGKGQPTVDLTAEAQAVRDATMEWLTVHQAKDFARSAAYYAPDGIAFYPNQDPLVGPAAIQAYFEALATKLPDFSGSCTVDKVVVAASGDMAVETGSCVHSNEGKEVDRGKYVLTWRKVDGAWKATTNMGVSTVPVTADTTAVKKPATNQ